MFDQASVMSWLESIILTYGPKVLFAIIVLIVGLRLIAFLGKLVDNSLKRRKSEPSLRHFLVSFTKIGLKVLLFVSIATMVGIATTSFIAILGAAGLAIGLALQGSLGNFAGGVLILMFKPFKVGNYITAQGFSGTVERIEIFNTVLKTPDNVTIIIPNGALSNGAVTNYSVQDLRRVDLVFGISYDSDIRKAKKILTEILTKHASVLQEPLPFVRVSELADNSVNFTVRAWTKREDYWDVRFDVIETVKEQFDKNKISIPFPQMDVYVKK